MRAGPTFGRAGVALLAAAAMLCAAAAPAEAGQIVYTRGANSLWAMSEDGSGAHRLLDLDQTPGMSEIDNASVQPNGTEVAFEAGWAGWLDEMDRWNPYALGYCGEGCLGYYELRDGVVTRMTQGPGPCTLPKPCAVNETDPRVATDGSVAFGYSFTTANQTMPGDSWFMDGALREPRLRPGAGGAAASVVSPCAEPDTILDRPAPNPQDPKEVLYRGCFDLANFVNQLSRSGPDPSDPSDDVPVIVTDGDGGFNGYDWRPDAQQIVDAEGGSQPGLWLTNIDPATGRGLNPTIYLLAAPANTDFDSPRYLGGGRIGFIADGDIWSVSTSCTSATCSFPGDATRLTTSKDVGDGFGYTSSNAPIAAPPPLSPGGGKPAKPPAGKGKRGGSGGSSGPAGLKLFRIRAPRLRKLLAHGLAVRARCAAGCRLTLILSLDAKTARRYGLASRRRRRNLHRRSRRARRSRRTTVGRLRHRLPAAKTVRLHIRLTRKARRRLQHAHRLTFTLRAVASGATHATATRRIKVRR